MMLIVVTASWALIRLAPGNFYTGERVIAPAIEKNLRAKYGFDKPWYVQYGKLLGNIARGDFGTSLKYEGQSVNDILLRTLPVSATLGLLAYFLALSIGLVAGTVAAVRQNSRVDYASMTLAMLGISIPNFVLGPLLVLGFSLALYWFPPARSTNPGWRSTSGRWRRPTAPRCSLWRWLLTMRQRCSPGGG